MDRFVAPQFIDVEDKIIGPITTRQFVLMIIGGVIVFLAFKILDTVGAVGVTLVVAILVIVFGFIKINGRRFHEFMGSMITALRRPKTRVWYKYVTLAEVVALNKEETVDKIKTDFSPQRKRVNPRHLSELALMVDTGGKYDGSTIN